MINTLKLNKRFKRALNVFTDLRTEMASIIVESSEAIAEQDEIIKKAEDVKAGFIEMVNDTQAFATRLDTLINGSPTLDEEIEETEEDIKEFEENYGKETEI